MASQLGRLLGVMILTVELSRIGVKRWELVFVCGAAFVGLGMSCILLSGGNDILKMIQCSYSPPMPLTTVRPGMYTGIILRL